jgi:hypothetical protein
MATFTPSVRTKDKKFNAIYIRISHNSKTDYTVSALILQYIDK